MKSNFKGDLYIRKPVQGATQVVGTNIKVVVCVVAWREGVEASTMLAQILTIFILVRKFLCAYEIKSYFLLLIKRFRNPTKEKHMFTEVCESR